MGERTRLGVLGWPVAHSLSPAIQNAALRAAGLAGWRYQLLPLAPELFGETVPALAAAGLRGANVTIPHKRAAVALAHAASPRARAIGAANTLLLGRDGSIAADNTDAPALIAAIPFGLRGATALVLGAGGSARAAVWALLDAGAAEVRVWNRTPARARELCDELGGTAVQRASGAAEVLVNCTAVGLDGHGAGLEALPVDPARLGAYELVIDLVYKRQGTDLIAAARSQGVACVDGLELLVGQGALSFEQFTGARAPLGAMRAAVGLPE
ncbi:MAG TPA: shikimate dehydrogenase [Solirubrobacteraceae bacterium]|nr:shikimate dehydrogenase [Solirubrobacteraceae bacterium]